MIRADPECQGLLYAGTETGIYVSTDDGANWRPFQLNLPVAPIHELLVKGSDLIAGTHGRSIWILDDLAPLRALTEGSPDGPAHLFAPRDTPRVLPGIDWSGNLEGSTNYLGSRGGGYTVETTAEGEPVRTYLDAGENPPGGVVVTYRLSAPPEEPITLTFRDTDGQEIRSFSSRTADDPPKAKERRAPAQAGWNRFLWDMRYAPATKIEGTDPPAEKPIDGPIVAPRDFTVTLKVGEVELTQPFRIVKPTNLPATQADLDAQEDLLLRIHRQVDRTTTTINRMRDLRAQLDGWATRTRDRDGAAGVAAAAEALRDKVLEVEKTLLVPDLRAGWGDNLNQGVRLLEKLAGLPAVVALGDYRPTDAAEAVFAELTARIESEIARFESLLAEDLKAFNRLAADAEFGAVLVP